MNGKENKLMKNGSAEESKNIGRLTGDWTKRVLETATDLRNNDNK